MLSPDRCCANKEMKNVLISKHREDAGITEKTKE